MKRDPLWTPPASCVLCPSCDQVILKSAPSCPVCAAIKAGLVLPARADAEPANVDVAQDKG